MIYKYPIVLKDKFDPRLKILMISSYKGIVVDVPRNNETPYSLFEVISSKHSVETSQELIKSEYEPQYFFNRLQKHVNSSLKSINLITSLFKDN